MCEGLEGTHCGPRADTEEWRRLPVLTRGVEGLHPAPSAGSPLAPGPGRETSWSWPSKRHCRGAGRPGLPGPESPPGHLGAEQLRCFSLELWVCLGAACRFSGFRSCLGCGRCFAPVQALPPAPQVCWGGAAVPGQSFAACAQGGFPWLRSEAACPPRPPPPLKDSAGSS